MTQHAVRAAAPGSRTRTGRVRTAIDALTKILPPGSVVTDPDVIESYRRDRAPTVDAGMPSAVVRVNSTADVQETLRVAYAHQIPVVPRGAGTGLSGGSSAIDGCITLSTDRMKTIEIDPQAMVATVQPGALNVDVKAAARAYGLWYPPDPSSFEICSIGGNLATNAGGLCCVKYGVTTDYVLGLEVVLADGRCLHLGGRTVKDVAGYDLKRLFVGSEGTLGVITQATLKLRPLPTPAATVVATFADVVAAGRAVVDIMTQVRPSALELMDRTSVAAVEAVTRMGLDDNVGALLLGQSDALGRHLEEVEVMEAACTKAGASYVATTADRDEGEQFMAARRIAIPAVERLGSLLIEDVGVPIPRIPELIESISAISNRWSTGIAVIGHAGDGNFHPLVIFDQADASAAQRAESAYGEVMEAAIGLGGTITGEHGIGTLKRPWIASQLEPDVIHVSHEIKQALDPLNILNPGKAL